MTSIEDLPGRIEAAFLGALAGEHAAGAPAAAGDLLEVADSIAHIGGYDEEDLRRRGLALSSQCGISGLLLRSVPFALLHPLDRPRVRREAYRCAALAGADEGTAVVAVATALLAADLCRFDLGTALMRVRQSLLEDAPFALLDRLRIAARSELPPRDDDPGSALALAVAALTDGHGIAETVEASAGEGLRASRSLAGALAGIRDRLEGMDAGWLTAVPHHQRAQQLAAVMAEKASSESLAGPLV